MRPASLPVLLLGCSAAAVTACTIPTTPAAASVPAAFAIQIQNAAAPAVDGRWMNTWAWGGGDFHLFVSPAGDATDTFTLVDGVITLPLDPPRRACINGEYEPKDNTTKLFMTERGDPRAVFTPVWGCRAGAAADAPAQLELDGPLRADGTGTVGDMGVREFNGDLDFRWTPRGSTAVDPQRPWTKVRLVVVG